MFEKLTKLIEAYLKEHHIPESTSSQVIFFLALIIFIFGLFAQLWKLIEYFFLRRNQRILNHDLQHFYSPTDVYNRTKYYIQPKFQNVAPSEDEEPSRTFIASAKGKLIPLFLKKVFPFGKEDNKHFLILADSGMGKTAFLINLFISYKNQWKSPLSVKKYDIRLFPVWHQDTFEAISKISDPINTILLLDAFDEDYEAGKDYKKRLSEILEMTNSFRFIVLTSRTQFFPSEKEEPYETGYFTGGDKGEYKFQKLYLSVFDDKDVNRYLKKRFSIFFQRKNLSKAKDLIKKCPYLIVRPMLLSHIDDLIKADFELKYSFQVYEEMIKYWVIRESSKKWIKKRFGREEYFQEELLKFSEKLAVNIYENRKIRNGLYISANENFRSDLLKIEDLENYSSLNDREIQSKSLLNRNAAGFYKFSHKSILEYFLAKHFFSSADFYINFDFSGMDIAERFFHELLIVEFGELECSDNTFIDKHLNIKFMSELSLRQIEEVKYIKLNIYDEKPFYLLNTLKKLEIVELGNSRIFFPLEEILYLLYGYEIWLGFIELLDDYMAKNAIHNSELNKIYNALIQQDSTYKNQLTRLKNIKAIILKALLIEINVGKIEKVPLMDFLDLLMTFDQYELRDFLSLVVELQHNLWMEKITIKRLSINTDIFEKQLTEVITTHSLKNWLEVEIWKKNYLLDFSKWINYNQTTITSPVINEFKLNDSIYKLGILKKTIPNCRIKILNAE